MRYGRSLILVFLVFVVTVIVFLSFQKSTKNKMDENKVTVRLKWIIQTQFAGYFVALDKGFYKANGLSVKIEEGVYGKNPLKTVKNGVEEFGIMWASDLVIDSDTFISLANIVKDNGFVLISKKDKGLDSIAKFRNKKISTWFIGHEYQLKSLFQKSGLKKQMPQIISQRWDMSQFYNDEVDIASAMSYNELLEVAEHGYSRNKLNVVSLSSQGFGFPGQNIFTTRIYYKNHPKICRGFVQASIKGWEYAIANPKEAVDIVMKYDVEKRLKRKHQYEQMLAMIKLIKANKYKIGAHNRKDYEFIQKIYMKNGIIKEKKIENYYYTDEFLK